MEKITNGIKKPKLSIFFYVVAIIAFCYTAFLAMETWEYINEVLTSGGATWSENKKDIIQYVVSSISSYLFYSLAFLFFGYCCAFVNPQKKEKVEKKTEDDVNNYVETMQEEVNTEASEEL